MYNQKGKAKRNKNKEMKEGSVIATVLQHNRDKKFKIYSFFAFLLHRIHTNE